MARGHLKLGPIVGHTDHESTRIWIRIGHSPDRYALQVYGVGLFPFISTEGSAQEFGTAIAIVAGLSADRRYRYRVLYRRRAILGASGTFRTMPDPGSMSEVMFVAISCNDQIDEGAWERLQDFID